MTFEKFRLSVSLSSPQVYLGAQSCAWLLCRCTAGGGSVQLGAAGSCSLSAGRGFLGRGKSAQPGRRLRAVRTPPRDTVAGGTMTSGARGAGPESNSFIEDVIEFFRGTVCREYHLLLTDDEAWEGLMAKVNLSRDEADALREALNNLAADTTTEDKDMLHKDPQEKESFGNKLPQVKAVLEEHIRKLHALADEVDKVHRDCTISHVVASSTGIASGILGILGLALAPVTAGVSLGLSATGLGLGAAAALTSVSTHFVEHANVLSAKGQASSLLSTKVNVAEVGKEAEQLNMAKVISLIRNCYQDIESFRKTINAIQLAKAKPHLVAGAKRLMSTETSRAKGSERARKAFAGTALSMTTEDRIMGSATALQAILKEMFSLVEKSKHLQEGAKAELAAELRRQAGALEKRLEQLTQLDETLQRGRAR
ncbi:apolipoprotein L2-like isoform X2 [Microcebus murinus]|uniref:apolipoprotein L2-like isoform X2 n=1 Tax=Microcebus murinus TaxID=30608 RepID=UPI000989AEB8|nr:apolipoprotein L2-like isoform X2 [Microcebus murinus]